VAVAGPHFQESRQADFRPAAKQPFPFSCSTNLPPFTFTVPPCISFLLSFLGGRPSVAGGLLGVPPAALTRASPRPHLPACL
jgi:hypothetical protein